MFALALFSLPKQNQDIRAIVFTMDPQGTSVENVFEGPAHKVRKMVLASYPGTRFVWANDKPVLPTGRQSVWTCALANIKEQH